MTGRRAKGSSPKLLKRPLCASGVIAALAYLGLAGVGVTMLAPLAWMVVTSLKAPDQAITYPPQWLPRVRAAATVEGRSVPLSRTTLDGRPVTVAELGQTPAGVRVRIVSPTGLPAGSRVVPKEELAPVTRVQLRWENYREAWRAVPVRKRLFGRPLQLDGFLVFYFNSVLVSVCLTFGQVFTSSLAAFAFARLRFPGRDTLFFGYIATLMVPGVVTMIPVFTLLSLLHLRNTYWALILPGVFTAYGTFLLRQFFLTLPRELEDAARMDGCGPFGLYRHIALPLSKPALATLTIFVFLHSWNDFLWPLIAVDDPGMKTLPVGLSYFQDAYTTDWTLLMAAAVMVMVPVIIVFFLGQRYFVRGLILSGLKA